MRDEDLDLPKLLRETAQTVHWPPDVILEMPITRLYVMFMADAPNAGAEALAKLREKLANLTEEDRQQMNAARAKIGLPPIPPERVKR